MALGNKLGRQQRCEFVIPYRSHDALCSRSFRSSVVRLRRQVEEFDDSRKRFRIDSRTISLGFFSRKSDAQQRP